jgi:hypothetical protein
MCRAPVGLGAKRTRTSFFINPTRIFQDGKGKTSCDIGELKKKGKKIKIIHFTILNRKAFLTLSPQNCKAVCPKKKA